MGTRKITFHRAISASWNGNGMGTDSARWVARLDGRDVGRWFHPATGMAIHEVNGEHQFGIWRLSEWKNAVRKEFPECPHGCGVLDQVDDSYHCRDCGDEWSLETVQAENTQIAEGARPTRSEDTDA